MTTLALNCNHCGAPLSVPDTARFVTCKHCGSSLVVKQDAGSAWTELGEQLQQSHESISRDLEVLKLQNELERLERQWDRERERFRIHTKHGSRLPDEHHPVLAMLVLLVPAGFIVFFIFGVGSTGGSSGILQLFGVLMLAALIFGAISVSKKRNEYLRRKAEHDRERRTLRRRIAETGRAE